MSGPPHKKKKIEEVVLVTGGSGLVGKALQNIVNGGEIEEKRNFIFLSSKDGDLRDLEQCKRIFEERKPTHVIHLAAFVGGLFKNMKYPVEFWQNNMSMNENVMKCCHQYKIKPPTRLMKL